MGDRRPSSLRRYSGRIVSDNSGGNPSFLEALKRSSRNSSTTSLDDFVESQAARPLSEGLTQASSALAPAPTLPFTLDLSPIIEDLHVFENIGLGPGLPSLQSLATIGADCSGEERVYSPSAGENDVFGAQLFVEEVQEEQEDQPVVLQPVEAVLEHSETELPQLSFPLPPLVSAQGTSRKPSLVLHRASVVLDEDQSLAHLPALTLTKPTPELSSVPVFENANPHLPSLPEHSFDQDPMDLCPALKPTVTTAGQSVSSLSLPSALALGPHSYSPTASIASANVQSSPTQSQHLRPPSPRAPSLSAHRPRSAPYPMPLLPRCTACGFGFGTGFDMASSTEMLNVSRLPCELCEEQWQRCVQWYLGGDDDANDGSKTKEKQDKKAKARFSWLSPRIKKETNAPKSTRKRLSLSILPGIGKRLSLVMPMVTTQTVTTMEGGGHQDEDIAGVDEFGRRETSRA
ncbi:hypothetical protein PM082_020206 [Marasmius tenuissimus]|nr:hypothetical protein PM082_020206 [Marasmius tenuissimus]